MCTSFVFNNIMRSQGRAVFSMIGLTSGGILNIILDPVFIYGFDMGIAGAAIATLISQFIGFSILFFFCIRKNDMVNIKFSAISKDFEIYSMVIKMGFPSFMRQSLASIATILLNKSAMVYGDAAVSAMSIVGRVCFMMTAVLLGFGQGFQPVVGFAYGAKKYERVRKAFRFTLVTGVVVLGVLSVICFIVSGNIISVFRKEDMDVIRIGTLALRLQCATMILQPITIVANMLLQSVGKPLEATFASVARQGLFFIPLILILPNFMGLLGVQISQPLSDVISALFCVYFIKKFFDEIPKSDEI